MNKSQEIIQLTEKYGASNYKPLPMVISKAKGVWVFDPEGNRYMDMLSCYSALNHGHCHNKIIKTLKDQADKVTLTSRAFHNEQLGPFCQKIAEVTKKDMVLTMNTGTEAVETAIKTARRWAYYHKEIPQDKAEIIACEGNFHGRTVTVVSFSTAEEYRKAFGAFTPGFKVIPYGDTEALRAAITPNTSAFLVEPIQGEGGIIIPPEGYLKEAYDICQENNILFMADEIQTGLGRTGKMFCCDWEEVIPDVYILGKALGGGVIPISAVVANKDILGVFEPGSHGSTFGGNPLACACAITALKVLEEEKLLEKSLKMGEYFITQLKKIKNTNIKEVRGRGLLIGVEFNSKARPYCEKLMLEGVLCKETHDYVVRFAPPLIITKEEIDWAMERINKVFTT